MEMRKQIIYGIFALTGVVVVTLIVVRTIRDEAEKTRAAMSNAADSVIADGVGKAIDKAINAAKGGGDLATEVGGTTSKVLKEVRDILTQLPRTSKPDPNANENRLEGKRDDSKSDSKTKQDGSEQTESLLNPSSIVREIFKTGREVTRALDNTLQQIAGLDDSEERELGAQLHEMIKTQQTVIRNAELDRLISQLAVPFLDARDRKQIEYTFTVIDDPEINAFAHVGGYVYVNKGLLEFIDNDSQLRFVVGHEIAHVDLKHCVEQISLQARASQVAGELGATIVQLGYDAIAKGYTKDRELEADAWSYRKLGNNRPAALAFLEKLASLEQSHEQPAVGSESVLATTIEEVENHFRSHPSTPIRIESLKKIR